MKMTMTSSYPMDFINYLKRQMRLYIYAQFPVGKTAKIQRYLADDLHIVHAPKTIAVMAMNNLKCRGYVNGKTEITINETLKLPGTNMKLIDACKLINFGATGVPGYPIFTEMFAYFSSNADDLYSAYKLTGDIL